MLELPAQLRGVGACLAAAEKLVKSVKADAKAATEAHDAAETEALKATLGIGGRHADLVADERYRTAVLT